MFLLLLYGTGVSAAKGQTYGLADKYGRNQVKFISNAPVEVIEGPAEGLSGYIEFDPAQSDLGLGASIQVEVDQMHTGITLRDTHLKSDEWLDAKRHPYIRFNLDEPPLSIKKKGRNKWFAKVKGKLSIKGRTQPVTVPVTIQHKPGKRGDRLMVKSRFKIKLADYGVDGPTVLKMIGSRVGKEVDIVIKLVGQGEERKKRKKYAW